MMRSVALVTLLLFSSACERERRDFSGSHSEAGTAATRVSTLIPGVVDTTPTRHGPYDGNAYGQSQGQRLFEQYNCTGCHAHGGGGQGPALMDSLWAYGSAPDQIFASIVEGRPNGMPSFRDKLTTDQVWQLVAYVQSLAGIGRRDVRSGREDHMQVRSSPQNTKTGPPRNSGIPPETEMP